MKHGHMALVLNVLRFASDLPKKQKEHLIVHVNYAQAITYFTRKQHKKC